VTAPPAVVAVRGLAVRFGGLEAVAGLDLDLRAGEVHGLIGPNGSGKSTVINAVTGLCRPARGSIALDGAELTRLRPHEIARRGVGRTFQNLQIFAEMTVLDNVLAGMDTHIQAGTLASALALPSARRRERAAREAARALVGEVGLAGLEERRAAELSFGQQRLVELARVLALGPRVLLLDEPAAGLHPRMIDRFVEVLAAVRARRAVSVLLVEHVIALVAEVCDRVTVLHEGRAIASDTPERIQRDARVLEAYLGPGRRGGRA
jgi:ABC-type branched-subunit amino acid transport system ATPase component